MDEFVNVTASGATPETGVAVKLATGATAGVLAVTSFE